MLIGPDNVRFTSASAHGIRLLAASKSSSHIRASPADEVAVSERAPAASAPIVALIDECSLSTGMNSVSICPFAIYVDTICGISVDGVIGKAGITSGFICLIAYATASFPDIRSLLAMIIFPPSSRLPQMDMISHKFHIPYSGLNQTLHVFHQQPE